MGMFEDIGKGNMETALLGLGLAIVAPAVVPTLASGLRPIAKALVKGGMTLFEAAREGVAEAGEEISDLVAESRAEIRKRTRRTQDRKLAKGSEVGEEEAAGTSRSRGRRTRT
jgi:Protein of unknown function (DUF5132)